MYAFQTIKLERTQNQLEYHVDLLLCRMHASKIPVWVRNNGKAWQSSVFNYQNNIHCTVAMYVPGWSMCKTLLYILYLSARI